MKKVIVGLIAYLYFSSIAYAINFGELAPSQQVNLAKICTKAASPAAINQVSPGNLQWITMINGVAEDDKETFVDSHSKNHIKDVAARLIMADGSISSYDKSNLNDWTETSRYVSYGGDTWNVNLTPQEVNDPDFGFALRVGSGIVNSYFLEATNFGFNIPPTASISGVTVEVKRREASGSGRETPTIGYIDHIRMSVCYTSPDVTKKNIFPLILATIGDMKNIRVAPGESLSIPMTLQVIGAENIPGATMQYQIRKNDLIKVDETVSIKTLTTAFRMNKYARGAMFF